MTSMTSSSNPPRRRRGPRFCPFSERDVVDSEYGNFPQKDMVQQDGSFPSTDSDQCGDSMQPYLSSREQALQIQRSQSGDLIGDTILDNEDEPEHSPQSKADSNNKMKNKKKKSSVFSRFLSARSKLLKKKPCNSVDIFEPNNRTDDTVVYEDILNASPDRQRSTKNEISVGSAGRESGDNGQIAKTEACEEQQQIATSGARDSRPIAGGNATTTQENSPPENEISPFPMTLDADNTASSMKKATPPSPPSPSPSPPPPSPPPPLVEIMKYQRRNSGSSTDVSSLSGAGAKSRDIPLEYYLAMELRDKESNRLFTEDILNIACHQDMLQLQKSHSTESSAWEPLPTCLVLLTDPMQRIFEMVSVMYAPNKDTVTKILARSTKAAKDIRLKKQTYVGLAFGGDHCSLEMIPQDILKRSVAQEKPLMAIPAQYSAHQIQIVGESLLANPSVQSLLDHQLKAMGRRPKTKEPEPLPITQIVVPPRRSNRKVESA